MKCTDCKYHVSEDTGYSNWTVEGTDVDCLLGLNPDMPIDNFFGEEKSLEFAQKCDRFVKGDGVYIDVDREGLEDYDNPLSSAYTDDPEIIPLLDKWENA